MKQRVIAFFQAHWLPILSGILIGTSYIPFPAWGSLIAFVPLWWRWWQLERPRDHFVAGWVTQFVLTLIGFNWVAYVAHEFGHLPFAVSILVLLIFASFANIYVAIVGWFWGWLKQQHKIPRWTLWLLLPVLTACGDTYIPTIFPWNFGYTWYWTELPLAHVAEWIGFQGLSLITLFLNLPFLYAWLSRQQKKGCWKYLLGLTVIIFIGLNGLGLYLKNRAAKNISTQAVNVLLVQANIGNLEKIFAEKQWRYKEYIVDKYLDLSRQGLKKTKDTVDFLVWPETAFPLDPQKYGNILVRQLRNFLKEQNVGLITGAYGRKNFRTTNSIFFLNRNGELNLSPYDKTHLLAFGEYLPGSQYFPIIREWVPNMGDFKAGNGPQIKKFMDIKMGPQICYESLFPGFTQNLIGKGAEIIVNVTNDSWYGPWQEPYQHLYMTLARSIEFRRPLIRSTNTGISTVALSSGKVLKTSPLQAEWTHLYKVPYKTQPEQTVYHHLQSFIFWLPVGLLTIFLVLGVYINKENNDLSAVE